MPKQAAQQLQLNSQNPLGNPNANFNANLNTNLKPQTYPQSQTLSGDTPAAATAASTRPQAIMSSTSINATSTNTTALAMPEQTRQPPANVSLVSSICFVLVGGALVCMAVLGFYSTGTLGVWYKGLKNVFVCKKPAWLQQSPCTPQKEKVSTHKYSDGPCKRAYAHGDGGIDVGETRAMSCAWGYDGAGDEMGEYGGKIGLLERWKGGSGSPKKREVGDAEESVEMGDWDGESQLRELETARIVCDRLSFSVV